MVWFKIDDNLAFHPKVIKAGNAAMGLWARAGSWSAQQLTDGFIPSSVVTMLGGRQSTARALVSCGLWAVADGGYQFHQWEDHQPTRGDVQAAREAGAKRQQRYRDRRGEGARNAVTNGGSDTTPARPGPSRPTTKRSGGVSHEPDVGARPPLYSNRCSRHGDAAEPGPCGDCADVRQAAKAQLRVVEPRVERCLIHALSHSGVCPGCAADEKAGNA